MENNANLIKARVSWQRHYEDNLKKEHLNMKPEQNRSLPEKERHFFGEFEAFRARPEGPYHIIKNITYALKKGSPLID